MVPGRYNSVDLATTIGNDNEESLFVRVAMSFVATGKIWAS